MQPYGKQIEDLFNGDQLLHEYHQDYQEGIVSSRNTNISYIAFGILGCIPIIYQILHSLDYNLLSIPELLWNCLVYAIPVRLLDAIENYQNPLRISNPALKDIPRTHAAKSEAMRRILGLDVPGGIIGSVAQASRRRLSSISGISMVGAGSEGRPAGLGNWDNSCYQNSVLQGLASLDSLSGYLTFPVRGKGIENEGADMKMAEALRGLISTLNDPENNGKRIWTPATLKNMSSWQQQDAQEYFSKVLDEIDKEVGKAAMSLRALKGFESERSTPAESPLTIYRNPLEGLIAQRVGCTKCGYAEGLSMIPFNCLTVPLGRSYEHTISECLDEYTKLERIEGVECGKCTLLKSQRLLTTLIERAQGTDMVNSEAHKQCQQRLDLVTEALEDDDYDDKTLKKCSISTKNRVSSVKTRQAVIARPPKSLVVHFNRSMFDEFTGELKKNYSAVRFPSSLNLGPWCLGSAGAAGDDSIEEWLLNPDMPMVASSHRPSRLRGPIYNLRAVVTHYGRHENGHYICYKKHPPVLEAEGTEKEDQWWRLSDDDVTKVDEQDVIQQGGVFMLFYDCVESASSAVDRSSNGAASKPIDEAKPLLSTKSIALDQTLLKADSTPNLLAFDATPYGTAAAAAEIISPLALEPEPVTNPLFASFDRAVATHDDARLPASSVTEGTTSQPDLDYAANIPLPSYDDSDLSTFSDDEISHAESTATATSVSDGEEEGYEPTKAIVVPPYIPQTGGKKGSKGSMGGSTGSLLMV